MPCDTISMVNLSLGPVNFDYLVAGLTELGLCPRVSGQTVYFQGGDYTHSTNNLRLRDESKLAEIKQATQAQIVKAQAKKFGWTLKETGKFQYQITKR